MDLSSDGGRKHKLSEGQKFVWVLRNVWQSGIGVPSALTKSMFLTCLLQEVGLKGWNSAIYGSELRRDRRL